MYNICLADPYGHEMRWADLCAAVRALFMQVVPGHATYDDVAGRHAPARVEPGRYELLCYVVPSSMETLVGPQFRTSASGAGITGWSTGEAVTGSEVYANMASGLEQLADLIFHEFLHNKLRMTDQQLHNHASGGLARSPIVPPMTPGNASLMRGVLGQLRPQWLGVWASANEPMRGL